jgi:fibronectin-binding autotransporter adhesin
MATWKKIIVSGSNAHLAQITSSVLTPTNLVLAGTGGALQNSGLTLTGGSLNIGSNSLVSTGAASVLTGSFSGSFVGTTNLPDLTQGAGIVPFIYDGAVPATVAVSGASALNTNAITKWNGAAFVNSSLTDNGTVISGTTSIQLTGASSILSGSFSGSFQGDGSGLSGIATNLDVSGSDGTGISIDLKTQDLTIGGTSNEIETTVAGTTVTIGLPNDVTIGRDLVVSRNLTVLGTASFQHSTNLDIADRFILMASGSNTTGDGGIVVQQGTQGIGETFAYDAATTRWGVTGSFDATQNSFTPEAFMATVIEGGVGQTPSNVVSKLTKKGNIFIQDNEDIWIFS